MNTKELIRFIKVLLASVGVFMWFPILMNTNIMWEVYIPSKSIMTFWGKTLGYVWLLFFGYCVFEFFDKRIK